MSEDDDNMMEIGAFDPVQAFEQTLYDLIQVIEIFEPDDTAMTPMEFLNAAQVAKERLDAIVSVTTRGVIASVAQKIPESALSEFRAQKDLDDLMLTPEEKYKRMLKALRGIANFQKRPRPPRTA